MAEEQLPSPGTGQLSPPGIRADVPPGWYPDPWKIAPYRWWTGHVWTSNLAAGSRPLPSPMTLRARRPRLPAWLSPPVLVAGVLLLPILGLTIATAPMVLALALVPLVVIVPVLWWIDRLEPEPWTSRVHGFLWGATISVLVASAVNLTVMLTAGETIAAVVSAPLVEETMKGLGILWALRRRELDGPVDGIVYAGWIGAGFALVENLEYFLLAADDGVLAETFVVRALLTPFAHPLFTAWIGLAVGVAVLRNWRLPVGALWGWSIAVGLHAAWNGSIVASVETGEELIIVIAASGFVVIFGLTALMVVLVRRAERRQYRAAIPHLALRYGLSPAELEVFGSWPAMLARRRQLPRPIRRSFDDVHAALVRLAALHARAGRVDPAEEARLAHQLAVARAALVR